MYHDYLDLQLVNIVNGAGIVSRLDKLFWLPALELFQFGSNEQTSGTDRLQDRFWNIGDPGKIII